MNIFKAIELPEQNFASKEEMFLALKNNSDRIIDIKKSNVYKACEKGSSVVSNSETTVQVKSLADATSKNVYPIISTTNFLDSHNDCHFDNCFNKTVKEQAGRVYYALDHELKYNSILAWQEHVKMSVEKIDWSMVGKNYSGQTEALIFDIKKENIRDKSVLLDIEARADKFENSIRMVYFKVFLGVNSPTKEFKENKEYYDSRIDQIANKEDVEKVGYFWGVEELGIHKEGSLVVAGGSNSATSIYNVDPLASSQKNDPISISQEDKRKRRILLSNY